MPILTIHSFKPATFSNPQQATRKISIHFAKITINPQHPTKKIAKRPSLKIPNRPLHTALSPMPTAQPLPPTLQFGQHYQGQRFTLPVDFHNPQFRSSTRYPSTRVDVALNWSYHPWENVENYHVSNFLAWTRAILPYRAISWSSRPKDHIIFCITRLRPWPRHFGTGNTVHVD